MSVSVIIKWGGQEYSITTLSDEDTVLDLKQSIKSLTGVLPVRQKLLGLKVKGKPAEDDLKLGTLKLKPNTKIMMMGSREESLEDVLAPPPENEDVVNDFDIEEEVIEVENREENLAKIARRVKEYKVEVLNPPREGKSLLVLDVDYTLFDHKSCAETGLELMRPYLQEFLTSAYEDYDIVIWSATSMKWIEAKMKELGVTNNPNYKITFMLDSAAMITVHTPKRGVVERMSVSVIIKWGGQEYSITTLSDEDTVLDLKQSIKSLTGVLPVRQKLLGLKVKGKPAEDDLKLGTLKLKPNTKIMMMGSREESLEDVLAPPPENEDVVNDFDIEEEVIEVENREENLAKIARRVKEYQVEVLNPPREGKSLLVLDVDYTLFDHKSCAETGLELMRPYLQEFLTSAYEDYDIVIWSATSMKWIEAKMKELGVTNNPNYKITFMLDSAAMITVHTPKRGVVEVKPLGVIWGKYAEFYNKKNTIMFDDIGRNFLMNPQNGLKIKPFMKAHLNREKDKELLKLSQYLKEIAKLEDFSELNHKHWERYLSKKQSQ
ncbi:UNVERIFIED_CONTAM: hypothetical protein FKN15_051943 [Acipenser sinensis]